MGLSNKQKNYIREQYRKKSSGQLAREIKADPDDIAAYIETLQPTADGRKKLIFLAITLMIPVLFFVILESSLRLFNYRGDTSLFEFPEEYFKGEYGLPNRNFNARYFFNTANLPGFSNDAFLADKPDTSFRVFVMGGSSTAGYPYGFNGTFSRVTADAMKDVMPGRLIEVVNIGAAAVNTYTLYDQIPEILAQEPDAIFIYTGHNEYYGALGVGSSEQFGAFPGFVRTYLRLQRLKTFMLIRDFIATVSGWIATTMADERLPAGDGTLMQRMVQDQTITLDSDAFLLGKNQFESNLDKILSRFDKNDIPVFISSIASNLKDQKPFVSIRSDKHPPAEEVFQRAKEHYQAGNYQDAYEKFKYAKDLDALKFRAPEIFNEIIRKKAEIHNAHYVPAYESLQANSINGIIGFDFMLEHLHANQPGYFHIGKSFFESFAESGILENELELTELRDWEHYFDAMKLSELDDRIAYHRIQLLTGGWPFKDEPDPYGYPYGYEPEGFIDDVAFDVVHTAKRWDQAKLSIAEYYTENGAFEKALSEYKGLIRDQPYNHSPYQFAGRLLLQYMNDFDRARPHFEKAWSMKPSNYNARMLGSIEVNDGNYERGISLLEQALEFNERDVQAMFNLSGAQAMNGQLETAYETAMKLRQVQPGFPGLDSWLWQLERQRQQHSPENQ
ncbi:tetratricopeptide repeat protein [Natronogracilivirga saccharolytica]|uniref:SGNH hydrolase-type esterase domain-containing protein n=1 Tax=Natronogracilivirga saccharolytica TaxID=2812953 RepID=A0A8J7UWG1_9BACT|nr:tetratricopeptide repeat protein [Natronogracilivirga saccharolytica]MBP3193592.1 hypothetical protein [Natronogracilivirga saccharolytica]